MHYGHQREVARAAEIPVLDVLDVVRHLKSEMDQDAEWILQDEVKWISAAKERKAVVDDGYPREIAEHGGDASLAAGAEPVEEFSKKGVDQRWSLEHLEALAYDR